MGLGPREIAGPSFITPGSEVRLTRTFNNGMSKVIVQGKYVQGNTGMAIIREEDGTERTHLLRDGIAYTNHLAVLR